jgi:ABC-type uncharacterized transport system substrate-binding protein
MASYIRRREFLATLGGAAVAWPLAARAQQPARLPTIGFLGANTPSAQSQWTAAFERRLRELGWIEGHNVAIEYRWAESRFGRSPGIIAEFIRLKVDVIVTHGTVNVVAAKAATTVIPIVFAAVADPVGNNLVAGLARPGGNVTGLSAQIPDLAGKRLELLREIIPGLRRLAIMANGGNPAAMQDLPEVQAIADPLGLEVITRDVRRAEDIAPAFESLKGRVRGTLRSARPALHHQPGSVQRFGTERAIADDARYSRAGRRGRSDVLRVKSDGPVPARR